MTKQEFGTAVEMLLRPRTSRPQALLRCADLYGGSGNAGTAIRRAGLGIVYAYEPGEDARTEYQVRLGLLPDYGDVGDSVRSAPDFDVLVANIAGKAPKPSRKPDRRVKSVPNTPLEHAMRFLYTRRPPGAVLWGRGLPRRTVAEIKLRGYRSASARKRRRARDRLPTQVGSRWHQGRSAVHRTVRTELEHGDSETRER